MTSNSSAREELSDNSDTNRSENVQLGSYFRFKFQKFFELRIARHDLLWLREFMIGQVITPTATDR